MPLWGCPLPGINSPGVGLSGKQQTAVPGEAGEPSRLVKLMHEMPLRPKLLIAESEAEDTGMLYHTFVYRVAAGLRLEFSEAEDSQERPF